MIRPLADAMDEYVRIADLDRAVEEYERIAIEALAQDDRSPARRDTAPAELPG